MNTIYDGSFVLGQTSATNFVAGPGIKIDEPSEGTVRIGNDETVLYSNTAVSNTIDLNEACTNFERLRLKIYSPQSTGFVSYHEIEPKTKELWFARQCMIPAAQYKLQIVCEYFTANNAQNYKFVSGCRWYGNNNVAGGDTTTNLTGASLKDGGYITEVIGINRISGSNA